MAEIDVKDLDPRIYDIIKKYNSVIEKVDLKIPTKIQTVHLIDTGNQAPVSCKVRNMEPDKLKIAKEEFDVLLEAGIARPSTSKWGSQIRVFSKMSNEWQVCGSYEKLSYLAKRDRSHIPQIPSVIMKLRNKKIFSKLEVVKPFYQVPINPPDIEKTAVVTPFGKFEFTCMPLGIGNAIPSFLRAVKNIFVDVPNCFVFPDLILIASEDEETHLRDVENVIQLFSEYRLRISLEKCEFMANEMEFLEYELSSEGVRPIKDIIFKIFEFKDLNHFGDLEKILSLIRPYRFWIPNYYEVVCPLIEMIRIFKRDRNFVVNADSIESIDRVKKIMSSVSSLSYPILDDSIFYILIKVFDNSTGAAIYQIINEKPTAILFSSMKLTQTQLNYSAMKKELSAAFHAAKEVRYLLEGQKTILYTDSEPLVTLFQSSSPTIGSDIVWGQNQVDYIAKYFTQIELMKDDNIVVADYHCRINATS